jgi:DNA-binding NarL/FixJ family response regulator
VRFHATVGETCLNTCVTSVTTSTDPETGLGSRISVLVADDDPRMLDTLTALIASRPFLQLVGVAVNAADAVSIATRTRPRVALIDVRMPGGGPCAARSIREASPGTRCVAVSAYGDQDSVRAMREAGVVDYLVKGAVSVADLVLAIRQADEQGEDAPA